jgi:hypothetical protein
VRSRQPPRQQRNEDQGNQPGSPPRVSVTRLQCLLTLPSVGRVETATDSFRNR